MRGGGDPVKIVTHTRPKPPPTPPGGVLPVTAGDVHELSFSYIGITMIIHDRLVLLGELEVCHAYRQT